MEKGTKAQEKAMDYQKYLCRYSFKKQNPTF